MTLVLLYVATAVIFLTIDYFGLTYLIRPTFEKDISGLLLDNFRTAPAAVFYGFFAAVLLWFVSWPAMVEDKSLLWVLGNGALIGALGYGTYEFTSLAVMKDWTWRMVMVDFTWGTCLTAVSAMGGVWVVRAVV